MNRAFVPNRLTSWLRCNRNITTQIKKICVTNSSAPGSLIKDTNIQTNQQNPSSKFNIKRYLDKHHIASAGCSSNFGPFNEEKALLILAAACVGYFIVYAIIYLVGNIAYIVLRVGGAFVAVVIPLLIVSGFVYLGERLMKDADTDFLVSTEPLLKKE